MVSSFTWRARPRPRKIYAESTPENTNAEMNVTIISSSKVKPPAPLARGLEPLIGLIETIKSNVGRADAAVAAASHPLPGDRERDLQELRSRSVGARVQVRLRRLQA